MDRQFAADILTGDSDEIAEIKANLPILEGFIELARKLDAFPEISKRFYEESRSLYQATSSNRSINELETILSQVFGPPVKPAGKPLPRKLRKNSAVKSLGGVEKDQTLFLLPLKTGEFYGALWPWRRNKAKIEIHMGYCSDWIVDEHYQQLETLVKRSLSHSAFQQIDTAVGGQIRGIGLPSFLQMAEMEQSSFTLRISAAGQTGQLYVNQGQLIAAQTGERTGCDAANRIISWEDVTIEIAPADPSRSVEIKQPLMQILMESLKAKDEITSTSEPAPHPQAEGKAHRLDDGLTESKRLVRLTRAPAPKMTRQGIGLFAALIFALGALLLAGGGLMVGLYLIDSRAATSDKYEQLRAQIEQTQDPIQRIVLLQAYLQSHPDSPRAAGIQSQIEQIQNHIEEGDFDQITLSISHLPVDEEYERQAIALCGDFLEKYPNSRFQQQIATTVRDIKTLLDQYYYEELVRAARLDFSRRLQVYRQYQSRFPGGSYQEDIQVLILAMGRQHLGFMKSEDLQCEKTQSWDACLNRYENFIADFKDTALAEEAAELKSALADKRDFMELKNLAAEAGKDYIKAQQAFRDYLNQNPQSPYRAAIEQEIAQMGKPVQTQRKWKAVQTYALNGQNGFSERIQQLDRYLRENLSGPYARDAQELMNQLETQRRQTLRHGQTQARQQAEKARIQREKEFKAQEQIRIGQLRSQLEQQLGASTRFRAKGDSTFTDQTSGLTWYLLDSSQELGGCLNYQAAQRYIETLPHPSGGWRLPTASELAGLYKQPPFFPAGGAVPDWYWTSEAYVRGYHSVADVVTSKPETVFQREFRRQDECGAVRAVRSTR